MVTPTFPQIPKIKEYHGIFTQTGTSNPVVTVLHNTLGIITWTRSALGIYTATSSGLFTENKTIIEPYGGYDANGRIFIRPDSAVATLATSIQLRWDSINTIIMNAYTSSNVDTLREYSEAGGTTFIKICVYQ